MTLSYFATIELEISTERIVAWSWVSAVVRQWPTATPALALAGVSCFKVLDVKVGAI